MGINTKPREASALAEETIIPAKKSTMAQMSKKMASVLYFFMALPFLKAKLLGFGVLL